MHLLVIDVQDRLVPALANEGRELAHNVDRLFRTARLLDIGVIATEQNPGRLRSTLSQLTPDPSWTI